MIIRLLLPLLFLCSSSCLYGQVKGCKDPAAINYNSNVTISDGSCIYNTAFYKPALKVDPLAGSLSESSGLQWDGHNLWTFNDGGGAAAIYKIDTQTKNIWQTVYLEGVANVDWEDMTFDGIYFYIGDFGNNMGNREDLKIYKFPATAIPDHATQPITTVPASAIEVIQFTYADQPHPIISMGTNKTSFDCEAMIVDEDAIHLFTKDWINKTTTHYRINSTNAGTYSAQPVESFPVNFLVTGADKMKGKPVVVLIGYNDIGLVPHYLYLLSDYKSGLFFNGNKRKIDLPDVTVMGQAEGITFRNQTYGYISNEQFLLNINISPKLRTFDLTQFIPVYVLPIKLIDFTVKEVRGTNQIAWQFKDSVSQLTIENSTDGRQFLDLFKISNTVSGNFSHKSDKPDNYYRLKWLDDQSNLSYSKIIKTKNSIADAITNVRLLATGELKFTVNSTNSQSYSFKVIAIDGKLLGEIPLHAFTPGRHVVALNHLPIKGTPLLVTSYSSNGQKTWFLSIQ